MLQANVRIEVRDDEGTLVDLIEGGNAVTRAGKEWAARKLVGLSSVSGTDLKRAKLQVNVSNQWRDMTVASDGRTLASEVATIIGTYSYTANNQNTTTARVVLGTGASQVVYAFFTLPRVHVGASGGSIKMTWTLRCAYNGANNYDGTEVSVVRESPGGEATRQLWIRTTDEPIVQTRAMAILYDATTASPNKFSNGQVRMFKFDKTGLSSDDIDEIGDAGPFPIVQEDPLITGVFSANTVTPGIDFTFAWSGVGSDTGVDRKRWFFMTMGQSAALANSVRWIAGSILESDNIPTAATTYVTGIRIRL